MIFVVTAHTRTDEDRNDLAKCTASIRAFHPDGTVFVVNNGLDVLDCSELGIDAIIDPVQPHYEAGAMWAAYRYAWAYRDSAMCFIQDSMWLEHPIAFDDRDVLLFDTKKDWFGATKAVRAATLTQMTHTKYPALASGFQIVQHCSMVASLDVMHRLSTIGLPAVRPNAKHESCAYERTLGMCLIHMGHRDEMTDRLLIPDGVVGKKWKRRK